LTLVQVRGAAGRHAPRRLLAATLPTYPRSAALGYAVPRVPAGKGSMIQLPHIKARIIRLRELTEGLGREVRSWQGRESPLLPVEQRQYLGRLQTGLTELDAARVVLAAVMRRVERQ
jgi:hypothetical protein